VAPSSLLNSYVEKGELGRKSGKGFYVYQGVGSDKGKKS